jgi:hypothetical protein
MTLNPILFAVGLGVSFILIFFPFIIFKSIDYIDYRLKQFIAWVFNILTKK